MYASERSGWMPSYSAGEFLTPRQCQRMIEATQTQDPLPAMRVLADGSEVVDLDFRCSDNFFFPIGTPIYNLIAGEITKKLIEIEHLFEMDLHPHRSEMLPEIFVNRYRSDGERPGHLVWHNDLGPSPPLKSRKLSLSILLNDPSEWEGGELDFSVGQVIQPLANAKAGHGVIFPSYVYHRVRPVTRGTRYSVVAWFRGPPLR